MQRVDNLYLDGAWRIARGPARELVNPATEVAFATVHDATLADLDAAVAAARRAAPGWAAMLPEARAAQIAALGAELARTADRLALDLTEEVGTPLAECRRLQVDAAVRVFVDSPRFAAGVAARESVGATGIRRVPLGVAACITPWNYPLYLVATKLVPALLAGCTVVLKPSELAPRSAFALAAAAHAVGLPAGVLNVLPGAGLPLGEALAAHPGVDVVSFTGSTAAGRRVAALAGGALKKVALELGGKSASVVLPDADLIEAVDRTLDKCFQNAGQTCAALSRLLVPRARLEEAGDLAARAAAAWPVGDPLDPATRLGPVVSRRQQQAVLQVVGRAIGAGARVVAGGAAPPAALRRGWFVEPTVILADDPRCEIAQSEVFGPVLTLLPYDEVDDDEDAIRIANATPYGLSGAVWSADSERALRVAERLRAGSVSLNGAPTHPDAPFGGFGASGFGRERGRYGLDTYSTTQAVHQ